MGGLHMLTEKLASGHRKDAKFSKFRILVRMGCDHDWGVFSAKDPEYKCVKCDFVYIPKPKETKKPKPKETKKVEIGTAANPEVIAPEA
eukprot:g9424.t1